MDSLDGHGTHVAGTIGAKNTGSGIVGVAPGVRLYAVRIFARVSGQLTGDSSTVACGIDWVASTHSVGPPIGSHPIDVANMSIQARRDTRSRIVPAHASDLSDVEHRAICEAADGLGIPFVVAAGNCGQDASGTVPAAYDEVITVSAMADYDGLPGGQDGSLCGYADDSFAGFSNYGAQVDLTAPGVCVSLSRARRGSTHQLSGTSMAAPHVTGAAARYVASVKDGHPNVEVSVDDVRRRCAPPPAWTGTRTAIPTASRTGCWTWPRSRQAAHRSGHGPCPGRSRWRATPRFTQCADQRHVPAGAPARGALPG